MKDDASDLLQRDLSPGGEGPLEAVWQGARGEWKTAHALVQDDTSAEGAWVHAWLHRIEGDDANAAYWYRRAHRPAFTGSIDTEARAIVDALLRGDSNQ
jgi:hypothetical protein